MIEIDSRAEFEDAKDLVLSIQEWEKDTNNNMTMLAKGTYRGDTVGLRIMVKKHIFPGLTGPNLDLNQDAFIAEGVCFESIGKESDELVKVIGKMYGFPTTKTFTKSKLCYTSFPLTDKILDVNREEIKLKLFFDDNDKLGLYYELYCNINLPEKIIELPEKDAEYRENVIKSFTLE